MQRHRWLVTACIFLFVGCGSFQRAAHEVERTVANYAEPYVGEPEPAFYAYTSSDGRTVYVSSPEMVPAGVSSSPVDLSGTDLNLDLGNDLADAADAEHERLASTIFCEEARAVGDAPDPVGFVWRRQSHWLGIGGVVLLLLLTAPWIARYVGAPRWTKVLALVIPLLLLLGVVTQVAVSTSATLASLEEAAPLCDPDALDGAASPAERAGLVGRLRGQMEQVQTRYLERIDAAYESASAP